MPRILGDGKIVVRLKGWKGNNKIVIKQEENLIVKGGSLQRND